MMFFKIVYEVLLSTRISPYLGVQCVGYGNMESTKLYLRIDLDALHQCAMEVPSLTTLLYGGGTHR